MKKSIGIFMMLLCTVIFMSSCTKDVAYLPGTWKATSATINGEDKDDMQDVWTFNTDGSTCNIDCDFDKYFSNNLYDVVTFEGTYNTSGNSILKIESNDFNVSGNDYDKIIYDLDIDLLNKNSMMVAGTVKFFQHRGGIINTKTSKISLRFSKR